MSLWLDTGIVSYTRYTYLARRVAKQKAKSRLYSTDQVG